MEVGQTKTCSKCGVEKGLECFARKKDGKFGVRGECKACGVAYNKEYKAANRGQIAAQQKVYKAANRQQIAARTKEYRAANRERKAAYDKEYRAANREQIAARMKGYQRARLQTDPQYRLAMVLRTRLNSALRGKYKTGSAVQDLGMPVEAFLVYLNLDALDKYGIPYTGNEHLFHIDHIRPLASFDLGDPEQLKIAVRWDNLQVLRAEENLRKGARTA